MKTSWLALGLTVALVLAGARPAGAAAFTGLGDLPGSGFNSVALGVSADESVVVGFSESASGPEAFRWTGGVMTGLGDLPGGIFSSVAFGVSADGSVVVGGGISAAGGEAFLWDGVNGMRSLMDVLVNDFGLGAALTGWTLELATAISADGLSIVGFGTNPNGQGEAWLADLRTPQGVPEPATVTLLVIGGLAAAARRKRKA
jgi:probable HAF family extracellular repeat protein